MIDAHMHYWDLNRLDVGWVRPDLGNVYRNFLPEDLAPLIKNVGVSKTIVVEAASTKEETEFLLQLYEKHDIVAGVVGGLSLDSATFRQDLSAFRQRPGLVGVRFRSGWKQREWETNPQLKSNLKWIENEGFPVDVTFGFHEVYAMIALMEAFPDLKVAIDPAGNPAALQSPDTLASWREQMRKVSSNKSVVCKIKLFGLMDIARPDNRVNTAWNADHLVPFVHEIIDLFGTSSTIFGTNWPVSLVYGDYEEAVKLMQRCIPPHITEEEKKAIFGLNAETFYDLPRR